MSLLAAIDGVSLGAGVVIGGLVALLIAASPWAKSRSGEVDFGGLIGSWVGLIGPALGIVIGLAAYLLA